MRSLVLLPFLAACGGGAAVTCDLAGGWAAAPAMGLFAGKRVSQHFEEGGAYRIELLDTGFTGRWALDGNQLTISEDSSCRGSGPAVYNLDFEPDCESAIYKIVMDPCQGRKDTLNGMSIRRL